MDKKEGVSNFLGTKQRLGQRERILKTGCECNTRHVENAFDAYSVNENAAITICSLAVQVLPLALQQTSQKKCVELRQSCKTKSESHDISNRRIP